MKHSKSRRKYIAIFCGVLGLSVTEVYGQGFTYDNPGKLAQGSGTGRADYDVWYPDIEFPLESAPAFANSQVYSVGGSQGPAGSQCSTYNYRYPWQDNFCETRGWSMPLCPSGTGHQGQDIRPSTCEDNQHWIIASESGVVTLVNESISAIVIRDSLGRFHEYLHWDDSLVSTQQQISKGQKIGRVSNIINGTRQTTYHLHFAIQENLGNGLIYTPPYMSLVRAYQRKIGVVEDSPVVIDSLKLSPNSVVQISTEITATVTIRNDDEDTVLLREILIAGRLNGIDDCTNYQLGLNECNEPGICPDFTSAENVLLQPGETFTYTGTFTPQVAGKYHFEVFYRMGDVNCSGWRWNVPIVNGQNNSAELEVVEQCITTGAKSSRGTDICLPSTATATLLPTPSRTITPTPSSTPTLIFVSPTATPTATSTSTSYDSIACIRYELIKLTEWPNGIAPLYVGQDFIANLTSRDSPYDILTGFDLITRTKHDLFVDLLPGSDRLRIHHAGATDERRLFFQTFDRINDTFQYPRLHAFDFNSQSFVHVDLPIHGAYGLISSDGHIFSHTTTEGDSPNYPNSILQTHQKDTLELIGAREIDGRIIHIDELSNRIFSKQDSTKLLEIDFETGEVIRKYESPGFIINSYYFAAGGKIFLGTYLDSNYPVNVVDLHCNTLTKFTSPNASEVLGRQIAGADGMLAVNRLSRYLRVFDTRTMTEVYSLDKSQILQLAGSPYSQDFYMITMIPSLVRPLIHELYQLKCVETTLVDSGNGEDCDFRSPTPNSTPTPKATSTRDRTATPTPPVNCASSISAPAPCPPRPDYCMATVNNSISVRMANNARLERTNRIIWRLQANNQPQRLVCNPTTVTQQTICLYDGNELIADIPLSAGALCETEPCWTQVNQQSFYWRNANLENHLGVQRVRVTQNARGDISLALQAKGESVPKFDLPISNNRLIAQWQIDDSICFESVFSDEHHRIRQTSQTYIGR